MKDWRSRLLMRSTNGPIEPAKTEGQSSGHLPSPVMCPCVHLRTSDASTVTSSMKLFTDRSLGGLQVLHNVGGLCTRTCMCSCLLQAVINGTNSHPYLTIPLAEGLTGTSQAVSDIAFDQHQQHVYVLTGPRVSMDRIHFGAGKVQ
jgi:hypothetical protein